MNQKVVFIYLLTITFGFPRSISALTVQTYSNWQCSLPTYDTVFSLVDQNFEAFQTIGRLPWMYELRKLVSCFQRGLQSIPHGLPHDMEAINLGQNSITRIRKDDFASYPSLVAVSVLNNCIPFEFRRANIPQCTTQFVIDAGAFSHLRNLTYLAISGNMMKRLPEMLPKSILILFASFSSLGPPQPHELGHLTSLEIVSFSTNCITGDLKHLCVRNFTIGSPIFSSSELKFLDLSYNNFQRIPSFLFQQSLLGIKLQGNTFKHVNSNDFLNLKNLTYLNLAWTSQYANYMQPLHIEEDAFTSLINLEVLDLSGNMISTFSADYLINNVKLKAINLEFNCFKQVVMNPEILPRLPSLEELNLAGNTFCNGTYYPMQQKIGRLHLGNAFLRFPNLTILELGMIDRLPDSHFSHTFSHLYFSYGLQYDKVDGNSLTVLRKLPRFRKLNLIGCGIRVLETSAFAGLNLTYLDISINKIGELEDTTSISSLSKIHHPPKKLPYDTTFQTRTGLMPHVSTNFPSFNPELGGTSEKLLCLSLNAITDLNLYPLKYFSFATNLDLSYNHINYIDASAFQNLPLLSLIDLRFNPIRRIHPETLLYLPQLSLLKLQLTEYQQDITFEFLALAQHNLTFQYGDTAGSIYRYFQFCRRNKIFFSNVTKLDLSNIAFPPYYVPTNLPIFEPLLNLNSLVVNGARVTFQLQPDFFNGVSKLQTLSMSDCWLEAFPYIALERLPNLSFLDLSHNKIEALDKTKLFKFPPVKILNLSHNFIHTVSPGTLQFLQANGLHYLDLSFNQIRKIDPTIVDRNILLGFSHFDLRGNAVRCVCTLSETFGWLVHSRIVDHAKLPGFYPDCSSSLVNYWGGCISCAESDSDSPLSLFIYSVSNSCEENFLRMLVLCFCSTTSMIVLLAIIFTNGYFRKKLTNRLLRDVRLQFFEKKESEEQKPQALYVYDGFVCYDKDDATVGDWVDHVLVPRLENESPHFVISVNGKDDWCGQTQVQQLLLKMKASRKVIIIFSKRISSTMQCQYVLSVLEEWYYIHNENKAIIITYGEHQPSFTGNLQRLQKYQNLSVLHYSTSEEDVLFWEILKNAMINISH